MSLNGSYVKFIRIYCCRIRQKGVASLSFEEKYCENELAKKKARVDTMTYGGMCFFVAVSIAFGIAMLYLLRLI